MLQHTDIYVISIHALREEGDPGFQGSENPQSSISIHALREEGDILNIWLKNTWVIFLSTPSARRATIASCDFTGFPLISIHALREEGDHTQF